MLTGIIKAIARELDLTVFRYKYHTLRNFKRAHGYALNLQNPKTFSEKIQWIKLYGHLECFSKYVDKYAVREFIKQRIGEQYLIHSIGIYERVEDIDYEALPNSFVMKATHGSGWNLIIKDKKMADWNCARETMRKWVASSYYKKYGEPVYKPIKGRVIIEEYLDDPSGDLKDYKIFCFSGKPKYIQVDSERFKDHKRDFYDLNWNKVPMKIAPIDYLPDLHVKPVKIEEMLELSHKLSQGFPFVRVDLYCTCGHIYFGELTFLPSAGLAPITPIEYNLLLGELIDLNSYSKIPF